LAPLWRDRYPSAARLVATLAATVEARARGVPTPRAVALLVVRGPGFLARGFMASEELEASEDLARRVLRGTVTRAELAATLTAVRGMHDRGVVHPDLNLGNVMLRRDAAGQPDVAFVDFDRARFSNGPASFAVRQAAIRRLERSCAKLTGQPGALGPGSEGLWYTLYAGDDRALAAHLGRGRRIGRLGLALHQLGWRRNRA
jgi:tRNA A-37 threonylcarbamoyl transferase component Bud32